MPDLPARSATPPGRPNNQALFGPGALIAGEDATAYDELLARVTQAVRPEDILEELWVRDVVDLFWDVLRLRRLKAKVLAAAAPAALTKVLAPHVNEPAKPGSILLGLGPSPARVLADKWAARDRAAVKRVDSLLASAGLTMENVMAQCLSIELDAIEQIDRMAMSAEVRRSAALRELDRHRASAGRAMRRALEDVEDAEFEIVAPTGAEPQSAA